MKNITAKRILEKFEETGLSYEDIAKKAGTGVSSSTLQRYATGQIKRIDLSFLNKIAPALNTNASYLAGWTDDSMQLPSNCFPIKKKDVPDAGERCLWGADLRR